MGKHSFSFNLLRKDEKATSSFSYLGGLARSGVTRKESLLVDTSITKTFCFLAAGAQSGAASLHMRLPVIGRSMTQDNIELCFVKMYKTSEGNVILYHYFSWEMFKLYFYFTKQSEV